MKNKKGQNTVFDNIKSSVKNSFGTLFDKVDNAFQKKEDNKQNETIIIKEEKNAKLNNNIEYKNDIKIESITTAEESLEQKIEKKVNKKILLEELSEFRKNINDIEDRLIEIVKVEIENKELERKFLTLKDEIKNLNEIYLVTLIPNIDVLDDNLEFEKTQIDKLSQMCDEELSKLKKDKQLKIEKENEIIQAIIDENLKEQSKDIDKLRTTVKEKEYSQKRITLVTEIHNFLSKTIDIGINLLPTTISQNKDVGILVSTIVLNNRIRNMRKIMRKENEEITFIEYKNIVKEIKKCKHKTKEILEDTLRHVENLKQEFLMEFYYDMDRYNQTEDIMADLTSIEYEITSKKIELEEE